MIELNGMNLGDRFHHIRRFWGTQTEEYNWLKHAHETFLSGFRGKCGHSQLRGPGISGGAQLVETHLAPLLLF